MCAFVFFTCFILPKCPDIWRLLFVGEGIFPFLVEQMRPSEMVNTLELAPQATRFSKCPKRWSIDNA